MTLIKFLKFLLQRISTLGHIVRLTISGICEIKTRKWSDRKKIFFFCSRIKKDIQIFSLSSPLRSTIISIFNTKLYLNKIKKLSPYFQDIYVSVACEWCVCLLCVFAIVSVCVLRFAGIETSSARYRPSKV